MAGKRRGRRPGWSSTAQELVDRIFVYGSLRTGQTARSLIAEYVDRSEPATTQGTLYALPDGYPVLTRGEGTVVGELLYLRDLTGALPLLDAYEGDGYSRSLQQVELHDGTKLWSWIYTAANDPTLEGGIVIESGDWDAFVTDSLT